MNTKSFMTVYGLKIIGLFQKSLDAKVFFTECRLTFLEANRN